MRKHKVTFLSPGSFYSEQTTRAIPAWDTVAAAKMADGISERYGAKPYGFYFTTVLVADDVDDGEGGKLKVEPKEVARSGIYYLGGELFTYADLVALGRKEDQTLIWNMRNNDYPVVVQNTNSWKVTVPFGEKDVLLDSEGCVAVIGNAPEWMGYRREFAREQKAADLQ